MSPAIETTRRGRVWLAPLLIALLAGCASKGPGPATESGPTDRRGCRQDRHRNPAQRLVRSFSSNTSAPLRRLNKRGQWTQALWHLDVLLALAPADAELQRRHANAQQAAQRAAAERATARAPGARARRS
jgi:hypothetical protein